MARVLGLEEIEAPLRSAISSCLRRSDEAIVLPRAFRSTESGSFKNVVFKLRSDEGGLDSSIFEANLFDGISAVAVDAAAAKRILADRQSYVKKLAEAIPSELHDAELSVGPALHGDANDRDAQPWIPGFDSTASFLGLFSAEQVKAPSVGSVGISRAHDVFFLVCRAGGGAAVSTFQARLVSGLKSGKTLDEIFDSTGEGSLGGGALKRAAGAGSRNRAMLLAKAASILGIDVDTLNDSASCAEKPQRVTIPAVDVMVNTLRKSGAYWQFTTGCDAAQSTGLCSLNTAMEGLCLFTNAEGSLKISTKNEAGDAIPFATQRVKGPRELLTKAVNEEHPDAEFVNERFDWKEKNVGQTKKIAPPCLWGSHASETYLSSWARELGLAALQTVRLRPECVAIASAEPSKLRAVVKKR